MTLSPIKLFRGDPLNELVESFAGFTDFAGGAIGAPLQAEYLLTDPSIADSATAPLAWDHGHSGAVLLDLTAPTFPAALVAGIYIATASVSPGGNLTSGGDYIVDLSLNGVLTAAATAQSPAAVVTKTEPAMAVTTAGLLRAGDVLVLTVRNRDGAAARPYGARVDIVFLPVTP